MRYYLIGGAGMLGDAFYGLLHKGNKVLVEDINITNSWISYGDIRDLKTIRKSITKFNPDIVINLAALTDLEYCERNTIEAFDTNFKGAMNLVEICEKRGSLLVHISTAGVFSGEGTYTEEDAPAPMSVYAKTKFLAEEMVLSIKKRYIFRAGWMMGGLGKDKKFIFKILKKIKNDGASELFVVDDKFGTPTYTKDFAKTILKYIEEDLPYGLYHNVGNGSCNRFQVAQKLISNLDLDIKVTECKSTLYEKEYFAPRPLSEILINKKLSDLGMNYMKLWEDSLDEYCEEIKRYYEI